ncbi:BsuBI/PstI family type II restriction endonuclease [Geothrix sp. PMB-07]|uniref:BsuBI/PstI family type II restriction endonuclease n=1 Tax=Geothrix sp. PMB-07 TaxID=3068640 RepID=UPI002741E6E2|nr:BsuBI/PstI family type II restriction endonuclease [Geothrix sp. PMB-07]WLT30646.1 BsuBI/PstI family type II restriction endonuclease [Geothrix sp. PMB-07]
MQLANGAGFDENQTAFVTAFLDRSSSTFKKAIVEIAWGSFVWLVSEPDNLIDMRDGRATTLHTLKAQG